MISKPLKYEYQQYLYDAVMMKDRKILRGETISEGEYRKLSDNVKHYFKKVAKTESEAAHEKK